MSEPTVAVVRDAEGATHFAARASAFVQDGLADGTLVEVTDDAADAPPRDGVDTGKRRGGSRDRAAVEADGDGHGD